MSIPSTSLKRLTKNPRYFTHDNVKAVYLSGSHNWGTNQNIEELGFCSDIDCYLDFLESYGMNWFKLWYWESAVWYVSGIEPHAVSPHAWQRTGPGNAKDGKPKFDLYSYNQSYFDTLKSKVQAAQDRDIYVTIMFLEGTGVFRCQDWGYHPMNVTNNINGIDGDKNKNCNGSEIYTNIDAMITQIQDNYIKKVIDTVNEYNNIIYEVCAECECTNTFQYRLIDLIRNYELTKPKQHPIGMTATWVYPYISDANLYASTADWIAPANELRDNPLLNNGNKVIFADTDHLGGGLGRAWVWKNFLRGNYVIFMDERSDLCDEPNGEIKYPNLCGGNPPQDDTNRNSMGYLVSYSNKMDLGSMIPSNDSQECSTTYFLRNHGKEYLIYQPNTGSFTANVVGGTYHYEWFNPSTGTIISNGSMNLSNGKNTFNPPFSDDAVLYLTTSDCSELLIKFEIKILQPS